MNLYKVIQDHDKSMKTTCSSACGGGCHVKSAGAKKSLYDGNKLNTLVASDMSKATKLTKTIMQKPRKLLTQMMWWNNLVLKNQHWSRIQVGMRKELQEAAR